MKSNESLPEGSIYDNNVGYNPKIEGYATFMSDMNELYEKAFYLNNDNNEIKEGVSKWK